MARLTQICLTIAMSLFFAMPSRAQTENHHVILFENLSREKIEISKVSLLSADGTKVGYTGFWEFEAGSRSYLQSMGKSLEGRKISYLLTLPDGASGRFESSVTAPLTPGDVDVDVILQSWNDNEIAEIRKNDKDRVLTKGQATYRYWNAVHGIRLEEDFEAFQSLGTWDLFFGSKMAALPRTIANRIADLDSTNVDPDAVAAAETYAELLRQYVKALNGRGAGKAAVALTELYQVKVDSFGKMQDENQKLAGSTEDFFQFIRSRRKVLNQRYGLTFPPLVPPVLVALQAYSLSEGYYVLMLNTSGDDLKNVNVRYRDAKGKVKSQAVTSRMTFSTTATVFDADKIDPHDIAWMVANNEWITVTYDGGNYSYPTNALIKK